MYSFKKEDNNNITLTIIPDDEYKYYAVYSSIGFFAIKEKNGFVEVITPDAPQNPKEQFEFKRFQKSEDDLLYEIDEYFEITLPSKAKFIAEQN